MDRQKLIDAIIEYDIDTVKNYLEKGLIHKNDEQLLELVLQYRNYSAFELLVNEINIKDRNMFFVKSVCCYLPIAIKLLECSNFEEMTHMRDYSNYDPDNRFFPKESVLTNHFKQLTFANNKEAFLAEILSRSLTCNRIGDDTFLVTSYLIENRKELNIKDQLIVQYLIENNYELDAGASESVNFFKKIIDKLIIEKIDLSLDDNGYLIQIAAFNNIPELLIPLCENGINIKNFLKRYNNKDNWLSQKGLEELYLRTDYNNERTYDIYKKFDEENNISDKVLANINIIISRLKLQNDLAIKGNNNPISKI